VKPKRLSEVRALISQPEFQQWWAELQAARAEGKTARERYDELLSQATLMEFRAELTQKNAIDTLYRAGEGEDGAASMVFEATELENKSFQAVAEFEEQRFKVSELWYRLGAAEKNADEVRDLHSKQKSKKTEAELKAAERLQDSANKEYEKEASRKNQLWERVELIWAKSAEVSLLVAEQRGRSKKIRKEAEALFEHAEAHKQKTADLRRDASAANAAVEAAEHKGQALLTRARDKFGCAAGTDFLYFRQRDNQRMAWCVSLIDDPEGYNLEVKPLTVYLVERGRGVSFLEPAKAETSSNEEGDRRFDDYFLSGRKDKAAPRHDQ
jgi:hypothetical protein